jgi:hypothetical protein
MIAHQEIKKGDQIHINYGNKPNLDFFLFYGFLEADNKSNCVILEAPLLESDKGYNSMMKETGESQL